MAEDSKIEYRERPILFSAPMVRALLDDTKTQTRRIANIPLGWAPESPPVLGRITSPHPKRGRFGVFARRGLGTDFPEADLIPCRYGQPGDRLWVKETFARLWPSEFPVPDSERITEYRADTGAKYPGGWPEDEAKGNPEAPKWKSSLFMRREYSRITLEIVNVRVERLQDISEADAMEEGIDEDDEVYYEGERLQTAGSPTGPAKYAYRHLWESLNGEKSWDLNPWVWCISFKRLETA